MQPTDHTMVQLSAFKKVAQEHLTKFWTLTLLFLPQNDS